MGSSLEKRREPTGERSPARKCLVWACLVRLPVLGSCVGGDQRLRRLVRFGAGGRDGEIGVDDGVGFADIGVEGRLATSGRLEVRDSLEAPSSCEAGVSFKANRQVGGRSEAGFEGEYSETG